MILGAQMFTIRELCQDTKGLSETLKKIADIGYTTVQVSGTCEYDPAWLKGELDKNGLKCAITHYPAQKTVDTPDATMEAHRILDCKNIGLGYFNFIEEGLDGFINKFGPSIKAFSQNGFNFCYHNHNFEFDKKDGVTYLEMLANAFPKNELSFTVDTYWVQKAGGDPVWWLNALKDRIPCVHLKDMSYTGDMAPVGSGNMNWDAILKVCETANTEYLLVEQDNCTAQNAIECLTKSYKYLTSLGLK